MQRFKAPTQNKLKKSRDLPIAYLINICNDEVKLNNFFERRDILIKKLKSEFVQIMMTMVSSKTIKCFFFNFRIYCLIFRFLFSIDETLTLSFWKSGTYIYV